MIPEYFEREKGVTEKSIPLLLRGSAAAALSHLQTFTLSHFLLGNHSRTPRTLLWFAGFGSLDLFETVFLFKLIYIPISR